MKNIKYILILFTTLLSSCSIFHPKDPFTNEVAVDEMGVGFFVIPIILLVFPMAITIGSYFLALMNGDNPFKKSHFDEAAYYSSGFLCYGFAFFIYNLILRVILIENGECDTFIDAIILTFTVGLMHIGVKELGLNNHPLVIGITKVIICLAVVVVIGYLYYTLS